MNEMGSLSSCVLENDPETQDRARWLRGKALAVSLTLEAALLGAVLILPLLNPGALEAGWWSRRCRPTAAAEILLQSAVPLVVRHPHKTKRLGYAWSALNLFALRFPTIAAGRETRPASVTVLSRRA